jgi:hypothetical protein
MARAKARGQGTPWLLSSVAAWRPFHRFGDTGRLGQRLGAQAADRGHHLARGVLRHGRGPHHHDLRLKLGRRIVDPVIDAAPAQRLVQFAGAVGGQDTTGGSLARMVPRSGIETVKSDRNSSRNASNS